MEVRPKEVRIFETADGKQPFEIWLERISDLKTRARIDARLARVRTGNFGDCRPVGEGVLELRLDFGPGYRIYVGLKGETQVIVLCGGDKSTQHADIEKAQKFWREYKE